MDRNNFPTLVTWYRVYRASLKPNGGQLEGAGKSEGPKLNDLNKRPWENDRILIVNDIILGRAVCAGANLA